MCKRDTNGTNFGDDAERAGVFDSRSQGVQVQVWPKHQLVHPAAQFSCSSKVFTLLSEQNNAVDSM